jgi:hypothetical protein
MNPNALPSFLYYVVMAIALLGWFALIFFPRRPWANFWWGGVIVPLVLCLFYMYMLISYWFVPPQMRVWNFRSLPTIYNPMFRNFGILLVAWINLTAMDLVAGAWMTRKAVQTRMPIPLLIPVQILTFVFAGFGFSLFALICAVKGTWGEIAEVEREMPRESRSVEVRVPLDSSYVR